MKLESSLRIGLSSFVIASVSTSLQRKAVAKQFEIDKHEKWKTVHKLACSIFRIALAVILFSIRSTPY